MFSRLWTWLKGESLSQAPEVICSPPDCPFEPKFEPFEPRFPNIPKKIPKIVRKCNLVESPPDSRRR